MTKKLCISSSDILSLNFKDLRSVTSKKLQVSNEDIGSGSMVQNSIRPWTISPSNQFLLSRNKIGNELLKHCKNGFHLDDPHMYQTRFYVDYHRLHDPALNRYYKTSTVKSQLKKLKLTNENSDAICSNKDFFEYLRYLDSIRAKNIKDARRLKV